MSPSSYTHLSPRWITCALLSCILLTGCIRSNRPQGQNDVSDRLINFLVASELPLGEPASPLRSDIQRCGQWVRQQLKTKPEQHFEMNPGSNTITATLTGEQRKLTPELFRTLYQLNGFFHGNSAVDRSLFEVSSISTLLDKSDSRKTIQKLVELDSAETLSETGGVVIYNPDTEQIEFHIIQPDNAIWNQQLSRQKTSQQFANELSRIKADLPYLKVRAERAIQIINDDAKSDEEKQEARDSFMELFNFHSRYSYILSQPTQYAAIAEKKISGIYLGVFHVHPRDNPPSVEDKLGSILRKNFVLVPRDAGIDVHYLDFTGDLAREPDIISISY